MGLSGSLLRGHPSGSCPIGKLGNSKQTLLGGVSHLVDKVYAQLDSWNIPTSGMKYAFSEMDKINHEFDSWGLRHAELIHNSNNNGL